MCMLRGMLGKLGSSAVHTLLLNYLTPRKKGEISEKESWALKTDLLWNKVNK